jgi:Fur family ferric uptake transcriptional regulator
MRTRQREVMLAELRRRRDHPTAAELYAVVRRRLPRISLGTVYRNLELFERHGAVRKLAGTGGQARYDGDLDPHHHVRCVRCGRLEDLPALTTGEPERSAAESVGYRILGVRLELTGLCRTCADARLPAGAGERPAEGA